MAEKYQTGFGQPLLTTTYVNTKLTGINAAQTLSRLHRTADRKSQSDLAVLDFANEVEKSQDAFRPYFEQATTFPTDPDLLYTGQTKVMSAAILVEAEMDAFAPDYLAADDQAK
ncbi:hypothetical protein [Sphaerisporangium dianthi]|uniref:Uncharacterized protein n=1 Tax=Sphaerisporangium dianthi TaxID=1436120 RepID=A0ABV9CQQ4_9ACTN